MSAKTQLFRTLLKIHPTKREKAFENLNGISFLTWAVTENPNFRFFIKSLACKHIVMPA